MVDVETVTNFVPIDRSTFRRNPDAGLTSKVVPIFEPTYTVTERSESGPAVWESAGPMSVSVERDVATVSGNFVCRSAAPHSPTVKTFRTDDPNIHITRHQETQRISWAMPAPPYLFEYVDALVVCPEGHGHHLSKLTDYEDDDRYATNLCPTCGERVEGIERERAEDVARELGLSGPAGR